MRASAHAAHVFAHIIAHDAILKFLLPIALGAGRLCRISRELGMGAGFRWGGLGAGQVCDQENYATGNKGADGLQASLLGCGVRSKHPVSENWDYRA